MYNQVSLMEYYEDYSLKLLMDKGIEDYEQFVQMMEKEVLGIVPKQYDDKKLGIRNIHFEKEKGMYTMDVGNKYYVFWYPMLGAFNWIRKS